MRSLGKLRKVIEIQRSLTKKTAERIWNYFDKRKFLKATTKLQMVNQTHRNPGEENETCIPLREDHPLP